MNSVSPAWATHVASFGPALGEGAWVEVPAWNAAALREWKATGVRARRIVHATLGANDPRGAFLTDADRSVAMEALRMMAESSALDFVVPTDSIELLHRLGSAATGSSAGTGCGPWPPNLWPALAVSQHTPALARSIEELLAIPACVRTVCCDPLRGPVTLRQWLPPGGARWRCTGCRAFVHAWAVKWSNDCPVCTGHGTLSGSHAGNGRHQPIDWVIVSGEAGPLAHRFNVGWAANLYAECEAAGVPMFFDQLGSRPYVEDKAAAAFCMIAESTDVSRLRMFPDPTHAGADDVE